MSRVRRNWWRLVLVSALGCVPLAPPAGASTPPAPVVTSQDSSVDQQPTGYFWHFSVGNTQPGDRAVVTLYQHATSMTDIRNVVAGNFRGTVLDQRSGIDPNCGEGRIYVHLFTTSTSLPTACAFVNDVPMSAHCTGDACNGVYPVELTIFRGSHTYQRWMLMVFTATATATPLNVAWVISATATSAHDIATTTSALNEISSSNPYAVAVSDTSLMNAYMQQGNGAYGASLTRATAGHVHSLVEIAPNNVDAATLTANYLGTDAAVQFGFFSRIARLVGITRAPSLPLVMTDTPHRGELSYLASQGFTHVVIPDGSLTPSASSTQTEGAPFSVQQGGSVRALTSTDLTTQISTATIEPARRAALLVGALTFIHFEHPYWAVAPTVVALTPALAGGDFLHRVAVDLSRSSIIHLISLEKAFSTTPIGANGLPSTRTVVWRDANGFTTAEIARLQSLSLADQALSSTVSSRASLTNFTYTRLIAERVTTGRHGWLLAANSELTRQLNQTRVDESPIILTSRVSTIPVTIINRTPGTSTVVVHFSGKHIAIHTWPIMTVSLTQPTTVLHIPIALLHGSVGDVEVTVLSGDQKLVLAHATIRVTYATVSTVGFILTFGALAIILIWWIRSWRRAGRGRHGRTA